MDFRSLDEHANYPLEIQEAIDSACDQFEETWKSGGRPKIEDYLPSERDRRQLLLKELLVLDCHYRQLAGDTPLPEDYLTRFPNDHWLIHHTFGDDTPFNPTLSFCVGSTSREVTPLLRELSQDGDRPSFEMGTKFGGRYVVKQRLGSGGMGVVHLAHDERLDRDVAVKVMLDFKSGDAELARMQQLFSDEARLGANLSHPAIATVFDYGFHERLAFIVFEYIPGQTLRQVLREREKLPLEDTRLILVSIAQALDFAHTRGVVHRDLKPENLKATDQGQFIVLDLGLAKDFHRPKDWSGFSGTPAYASPEQSAGLPADGRSDQYSLALIAYEMLSGRRAFSSTDAVQLLRMQREERPVSPNSYLPSLPTSVDTAILKALAKDPSDRFANCQDFAVALGCQFLSGVVSTPTIEIIRESPIAKSLRAERFTGPLKRVAVELGSFTPLVRGYLLLTPQHLWFWRQRELYHWPLADIAKVRQRRRKLIFTFNYPQAKRWVVWLRSRSDCRAWYDALEEQRSSQSDNLAASSSPPSKRFVTVNPGQPKSRHQALGTIEAEHKRTWVVQAMLQIRAALLGADSVINASKQTQYSHSRTTKRISGTAIRFVDNAGRRESLWYWSGQELGRLTSWVLIVEILIVAVFATTIGSLSSLNSTGILFLLLLVAGWPVALPLLGWWLRWPQLARPLSMLFFVLSASYFVKAIGILCAGLMDGVFLLNFLNAVNAITGNNIIWIVLSGTVAFRFRQIDKRFRGLVPAAEQESSQREMDSLFASGFTIVFCLFFTFFTFVSSISAARVFTKPAGHLLSAHNAIDRGDAQAENSKLFSASIAYMEALEILKSIEEVDILKRVSAVSSTKYGRYRDVRVWSDGVDSAAIVGNFVLSETHSPIEAHSYLFAEANRKLGMVYDQAGRFEQSAASLENAVVAFSELVNLNRLVYQFALAETYRDLGNVRFSQNRFEDAKAAFKATLEICDSIENGELDPAFRQLVADALTRVDGIIEINTDVEARYYKNLLESHERNVNEQPDRLDYQVKLAECQFTIGKEYVHMGRLRASEGSHLRCLKIFLEIHRKDPSEPKYQRRLAEVYSSLGNVLQRAGRYEDAASAYLDAIQSIDGQSLKAREIHEKRFLAVLHDNISWLRATCPSEHIRNSSDAIEFANEACEITDWQEPLFLDTLAAAYAENGEFSKATHWQHEAVSLVSDDAQKRNYQFRLDQYKSRRPHREGYRELLLQLDR